jgi:serine/threonine protein kinase
VEREEHAWKEFRKEYEVLNKKAIVESEFGKVMIVKKKGQNEKQVVKTIPLERAEKQLIFQNSRALVEDEWNILGNLHHVYILKIVDVMVKPGIAFIVTDRMERDNLEVR